MSILVWKDTDTFDWRNRASFVWQDPTAAGEVSVAFSSLNPDIAFSQSKPEIDFSQLTPKITLTS